MMKVERIKEYQGHLLLLKRLTISMFVIQLISGLYHLLLPIEYEPVNYSRAQLLIIGIISFVVGLLIMARRVDLNAEKSMVFFRVITFGGIIHQNILGLNTLFSITFLVLAIIGEHLLFRNMVNIQRTQNFASHEKLTPQVYKAIVNADNYLKGQLDWVSSTLVGIGAVAIFSIVIITILTLIPQLIGSIQWFQYLSIAAIMATIILVLLKGFPEVEVVTPESEFQF